MIIYKHKPAFRETWLIIMVAEGYRSFVKLLSHFQIMISIGLNTTVTPLNGLNTDQL